MVLLALHSEENLSWGSSILKIYENGTVATISSKQNKNKTPSHGDFRTSTARGCWDLLVTILYSFNPICLYICKGCALEFFQTCPPWIRCPMAIYTPHPRSRLFCDPLFIEAHLSFVLGLLFDQLIWIWTSGILIWQTLTWLPLPSHMATGLSHWLPLTEGKRVNLTKQRLKKSACFCLYSCTILLSFSDLAHHLQNMSQLACCSKVRDMYSRGPPRPPSPLAKQSADHTLEKSNKWFLF